MKLNLKKILDALRVGDREAQYIVSCALTNLETTDKNVLHEHYGSYLAHCLDNYKN